MNANRKKMNQNVVTREKVTEKNKTTVKQNPRHSVDISLSSLLYFLSLVRSLLFFVVCSTVIALLCGCTQDPLELEKLKMPKRSHININFNALLCIRPNMLCSMHERQKNSRSRNEMGKRTQLKIAQFQKIHFPFVFFFVFNVQNVMFTFRVEFVQFYACRFSRMSTTCTQNVFDFHLVCLLLHRFCHRDMYFDYAIVS